MVSAPLEQAQCPDGLLLRSRSESLALKGARSPTVLTRLLNDAVHMYK